MSDKRPVADARQVQKQDANFVLIVLNASQTSRAVDIQVRIDGELAVTETFSNAVSSSIRRSVPPRKAFYFRLAPGTHTLAATTAEGGAGLEERFDLSASTRWALLGYEYWSGTAPQPPPGQFEFTIQDTPIYFQ